jgi:hypothetical protein
VSSFHGKFLPPITDDVMFEKFTAMLWERRHPESTAVLMGRSGQAQSGLDVLVTTRTGKTIGIQCKAVKLLTEKTLLEEVDKALKFEPIIDQFVLATTAPHDVAMVAAAQRVSEEHSERDLFSVTVFGWGELLRLVEPHPEVIQLFYPEFAGAAQVAPTLVSLVIEPDLSIAMNDLELALFCSETAATLAENDRAAIQIHFAARTAVRGEIAQLDAEETLTTGQRMHRSNLEASLARISPRLRQLEQAIPILLTDDDVRSPWLIGPNWPKTAPALRRLVNEVLRPATSFGSHAMALKIRSPRTPAIVAWLDLDKEEQAAFRARNPDYSPNYFLGSVFDFGDDLGLRALSAGIAAVFRYSAGHKIPLDTLRTNGEMSVFQWWVEAA